jgi:hypothetical protein
MSGSNSQEQKQGKTERSLKNAATVGKKKNAHNRIF